MTFVSTIWAGRLPALLNAIRRPRREPALAERLRALRAERLRRFENPKVK